MPPYHIINRDNITQLSKWIFSGKTLGGEMMGNLQTRFESNYLKGAILKESISTIYNDYEGFSGKNG